jgi:hypothetical protein
MPTPAPELETLKIFSGNWKCDSKFPAGSMGPGSPEMTAKSGIKFKKVLGGFWTVGDYAIKKSKAMPGMNATFYMGYDAASKKFLLTGLDSMGGLMNETSAGFQGDTITWTGEGYMMGQKMKIREKMIKKSDKEVLHTMEADMGKGFMPMGEDACKK